MNLLIVWGDRFQSLCGTSGEAAQVRGISQALAQRGHAVTLLCHRNEGINPAPPGVNVRLLPADNEIIGPWISQHIADVNPNAVLERYTLTSGPALTAAHNAGIPLLLQVAAPLAAGAHFRDVGEAQARRERERQLFAAADHVIACSSTIWSHLMACGVRDEALSVIPSGVDISAFTAADGTAIRQELGLADTSVLGFCGQLNRGSGITDLLMALPWLPENVRLLIVGDGYMFNHLRAQYKKEPRVVFTGAVPVADVPRYLAAMDIATAPTASTLFYAVPLKVLDYLAAGLPVIACGRGELRHLGKPVTAVPPSSPRSLAAAAVKLLGDPKVRAQMAREARAAVRGRSFSTVAEQLEAALSRRNLVGHKQESALRESDMLIG